MKIKRWLHNLKEYFSLCFLPFQYWLIKQIPRDHCENDELLWLVSKAILVRFVEQENGLNKREPENEKQKLEDDAVVRAYLLVSKDIPRIESRIAALADVLGRNNQGIGARQRVMDKKFRLGRQLELMKTKVCVLVAHNRSNLWI